MPWHRRRVYIDRSASRRTQMEGWLSLSIYLSATILVLSLLGCMPDLVSSIFSWLLPENRIGASVTERSSVWAVLGETLMAISGAYLVVALFIKSHGGQGPH